jgi:predicted transporter
VVALPVPICISAILVDIAMGRFILSNVVVPLEPTSIVAAKFV